MLLPLVVAARPPMQDFPVHLATLKILHHFHDPAFGFDQTYQVTLGRTQYVGLYAVGHLLAYVVGVHGALVLLVGAYLVGTLHGLRALLRAQGRDEALAYLAVPALFGPLFGLGLLPFLFAIPAMLFGVAALVARERDAPRATTAQHALIAGIGAALVYLHVLPLFVFLVATLVLFPWRGSWRARGVAAASAAPMLGLLVWWLTATNVGRRIAGVGASWGTSERRPPLALAFADLHPWIADAYRDASDELVMALVIGCALAASALVFRERGGGERNLAVRAYAVLPAIALLLFLTGERGRGSIWPLAQRWALLAALLATPLLALPSDPRFRRWLANAAMAVAVLGIGNATWHAWAFDRETAVLPRAFEAMGNGRRVAMLAFDRRAERARFEPLMHAVSYYQAERGGVVAFSFGGFDYWPIDFQRGKYPIWDGPFTPRWESLPEVAIEQPLGAFDFVLARDRGARPVPGFRPKWREGRWEVLERADGSGAGQEP